jgi:hypothetical protein
MGSIGFVAGQLLPGSLVPECASIATPRCTKRCSRGGDGGRVARRYKSLKSSGLSSAIEGCSSNEQMSPPPKSSSDGGCARRFGGGTCVFAGAFLPLTIKALPEKCQSSYGSATLLLICHMVAGGTPRFRYRGLRAALSARPNMSATSWTLQGPVRQHTMKFA